MGSVQDRHVRLHLEQVICKLGYLWSNTLPHLKRYVVTHFTFLKNMAALDIWILYLAVLQ